MKDNNSKIIRINTDNSNSENSSSIIKPASINDKSCLKKNNFSKTIDEPSSCFSFSSNNINPTDSNIISSNTSVDISLRPSLSSPISNFSRSSSLPPTRNLTCQETKFKGMHRSGSANVLHNNINELVKKSRINKPISNNRQRRVVSLDSNPKVIKNKNHDKRSTSTGSINDERISLMRRITFEEVDLTSTPLSSLRSCSEFTKNELNKIERRQLNNKVKKNRFFSKISLWFKSFRKDDKDNFNNKTIEYSEDGPDLFLIRQMKGGDININCKISKDFYDNFEVSDVIKNSSSKRNKSKESISSNGSKDSPTKNNIIKNKLLIKKQYDVDPDSSPPSCLSFNQNIGKSKKKSYEHRRSIEWSAQEENRRRKIINDKKKSLFYETTSAINMLLGISIGGYDFDDLEPFEIELKDFKQTCDFSTIRYISNSNSLISQMRSNNFDENLLSDFNNEINDTTLRGDLPRPSISHITITRMVSELSLPNPQDSGNQDNQLLLNDIKPIPSLYKALSNKIIEQKKILAIYTHQKFFGPDDELFYESIRIQPFSSGAYLRGMLSVGFCSYFFNLYNLTLWPDLGTNLNPVQSFVSTILFTVLLLQSIVNTINFPIRLNLHFKCWESSRSVEVDTAINSIRVMLESDLWIFNRLFGRILDSFSFFTVIFAEFYLCFGADVNDLLRPLLLSCCATNILTFTVRIIIAVSFSLSMHDPQVLSDARRRGLSRWDIEVLPTFVFTNHNMDEVNNIDCSICLNNFEMGEMLISLPCDKKHSFHATCIRQWLRRQNSCPLCQKLV
jgi:hypothetical protein